MLADSGIWLECVPHAGKAFSGLFKAEGLKKARRSGRGTREGPALIEYIISTGPSLLPLRYQKVGERQRPARTATLMDPTAARAWLEERLDLWQSSRWRGWKRACPAPGRGLKPPQTTPPCCIPPVPAGRFNRPERAHKPDRTHPRGGRKNPAHEDLPTPT